MAPPFHRYPGNKAKWDTHKIKNWQKTHKSFICYTYRRFLGIFNKASYRLIKEIYKDFCPLQRFFTCCNWATIRT